MVNDQLSDFLTRIRNAGLARRSKVDALNSRTNRAVADILVKEGYLKSYREVSVDNRTCLRVYLRFEGGDLRRPVIQGLRRASRPGLRRYVGADKLPRVMNGFGKAIISTSRGIMTNEEARKLGVGGEFLLSVW